MFKHAREAAWRSLEPLRKACERKSPEPTDWYIVKNGYYYRPNAAGYTRNYLEAGLYTRTEAEVHVLASSGEVDMRHIYDERPMHVTCYNWHNC